MKYFRKEWNDFEKMKVIMDEFTQDDLHAVILDSDEEKIKVPVEAEQNA
jgi:hypothetical protein